MKTIGEIYLLSLKTQNPVTRSVYRQMFCNRLDRIEKSMNALTPVKKD